LEERNEKELGTNAEHVPSKGGIRFHESKGKGKGNFKRWEGGGGKKLSSNGRGGLWEWTPSGGTSTIKRKGGPKM